MTTPVFCSTLASVNATTPMLITCDGTCGWSADRLYGSHPLYADYQTGTITRIHKGVTCRAARHAGIIPATGGTYEVRRTPTPSPIMTASTANGVTTLAHPEWDWPTFSVHAVTVVPAAPKAPPPASPTSAAFTLISAVSLFPANDCVLNVAFMGVPNSGKSALINALASYVAGTDSFRAEDTGGASVTGQGTSAVWYNPIFGPNPGRLCVCVCVESRAREVAGRESAPGDLARHWPAPPRAVLTGGRPVKA